MGNRASAQTDSESETSEPPPRVDFGDRLKKRASTTSTHEEQHIRSFELTRAQLTQVQSIWNKVQKLRGPSYPADAIFERVFAKAPEAKLVFHLDDSVDKLGKNEIAERYRAHFVKFSESMGYVVNNYDDLHALSDYLVQLGIHHASFRDEGFSPKLWNVFAESLIGCTLDWGMRNQKTAEIQEAWTKLVLFILDRMKDGYYSEVKRRYSRFSRRSRERSNPPYQSTSYDEAQEEVDQYSY